MDKKRYRLIDVTILTVITCALEAVNILAVKKLFPDSLFSLSIVIPMTAVVMIRWRGFAAVTVGFSGFIYCILLGGVWQQYLIYIVGSGAVMFNLVWFKLLPHKKNEGNPWLLIGFTISAFILANLGRATAALTLNPDFFTGLKMFFLGDLLNIIIGGIIIFTASRQRDMLVYQPDYLKRLDEERRQKEKTLNQPYYNDNDII